MQRELLHEAVKTNRRFLHAQWAWALGHLGLLNQILRYFRLHVPEMAFTLVANGSANPWFLDAICKRYPLTVMPALTLELADEAMHRAVYFGCPDGVHSLVNFYKMIERECAGDAPLALSDEQLARAQSFKSEICAGEIGGKYFDAHGKFVAVHARGSEHEPERNVTVEQIEAALEPWKARGYSVISTGLDPHPINDLYPSVTRLVERYEASFLLSASCDQFIGSNSGAWTIAHAYCRPVTILNDYEHAAWIYP